MADILIRGMELPAKPTAITIMPNGDIYDFFIDTKYGTAVELPPHGDLIERDALETDLVIWNGECGDPAFSEEAIDNAPVIVPASEPTKSG